MTSMLHLGTKSFSGFRKFGTTRHFVGTRKPTVRRCLASDDADRLAEVEAMQLYAEAQELSQKQVLQELMQMELSEMSYYRDEPETPPPTPAAAAAAAPTARQASTSPHPGSVRRVPVTAASVSPLQCFWVEQGLKANTANSIARDMVEAQSQYCDITLLANQVQRLGRVIPGRVQDMVARDWRILDATPMTVAQHYVQLVQLFPNNLDVSELACKQPKLLYCDDLVGQFEAVVAKLSQLHPSQSREEARALLIEYPELMFRMSYYMHVRTLDELPMELQNIMIHTGGGLQALWQHYSDSVSPRFL